MSPLEALRTLEALEWSIVNDIAECPEAVPDMDYALLMDALDHIRMAIEDLDAVAEGSA